MLASASNAIVIGFNVRPDANARVTAERENVDVRLHRIIYKVIEEIEAALKGMLDPVYAEKVIGQATIRQTFKVSKVGTIAGCYVTEGKVTRDSQVRVIRDGIVIFEGEIDTLKRFKDDVREVAQGYECGLTIKNYNDLKEGDTLEFFVMETVKN
jgi:translation initiation factor IF-2